MDQQWCRSTAIRTLQFVLVRERRTAHEGRSRETNAKQSDLKERQQDTNKKRKWVTVYYDNGSEESVKVVLRTQR